MNCDYNKIEEIIEILSGLTEENEKGFKRFSYTEEDIKAKKYIIDQMKKLKLKVSMDLVGNIFGRREGDKQNLPPILIGSHLDTVKNGGKYDGVSGIVAGLEVMRVMEENNIQTKHPIELVAFAEEEGGRFNSAFIGSKWFGGKLSYKELENIYDNNGISLKEALEELNILNNEVERCIKKDSNVLSMIELHCEQGPILENKKTSLGVVDSIIGSSSYQVDLLGQADHAGTTPMNVRKDPYYVASKIAVELNEYVKKQRHYSVGTIGYVNIKPNVYNIIPEKVTFVMDIRSINKKVLDSIIKHIKEYLEKISRDNHIDYQITKKHHEYPVKLSTKIVDILINNAQKRNYNFRVMGSGAGHDALIMADLTDVAMIFVPSKDGRSHCPEEYSDPKNIAKGADILLDTIIELGKKVN